MSQKDAVTCRLVSDTSLISVPFSYNLAYTQRMLWPFPGGRFLHRPGLALGMLYFKARDYL